MVQNLVGYNRPRLLWSLPLFLWSRFNFGRFVESRIGLGCRFLSAGTSRLLCMDFALVVEGGRISSIGTKQTKPEESLERNQSIVYILHVSLYQCSG